MARAKRRAAARKPARPASQPGFVGRDPSPVLERYPPKPGASPPPPPIHPTPSSPTPSAPAPPGGDRAPSGASAPPEGLIRLERPFDVDEFSQLLGETAVRLTVPADALAEVLRRVVEFMGFGIYVYEVSVRPAPAELLQGYLVELRRVEYDGAAGAWKPFVERGTAGPA